MSPETHAALHKLWTRAVGEMSYVKADWLALEKAIYAECKRAEDAETEIQTMRAAWVER